MSKPIIIIPAREGSRRLPHKNRKMLGDKQLFQWTLDEALKCIPNIGGVLFTTDDPVIQEIIREEYRMKNGIILDNRPRKYAQDDTEAWEVIEYLYNKFGLLLNRYTPLIYIQPTTPFILKKDILNVWKLYEEHMLPAMTVCYEHKWKYRINGGVYVADYKSVIKHKGFWRQAQHLYVMPPDRSVDIDTQEDWNKAEEILAKWNISEEILNG